MPTVSSDEPDETDSNSDTSGSKLSSIERRTYLKLTAGAGASFVTVGRASASSGYGSGGYGDGAYGDRTTDLVVSTSNATEGGTDTATLTGALDDLGGATSADCCFEYREAGTSTWSQTSTQTLSSTGNYDDSVSGLTSGTDYEFRALADASDGDSDTGSTNSFTTDTSNSAPEIDSLSVSEAGSPNPHAEITVDWMVSDVDGDLSQVVIEVLDTSGNVVDASQTSVGGSSASGRDQFKIKHVNGESFDVTLSVTDAASNTTTQTKSVTE